MRAPETNDLLLCILNNIWVQSDNNVYRCVFCAGEHPIHKHYCEIHHELHGYNDDDSTIFG